MPAADTSFAPLPDLAPFPLPRLPSRPMPHVYHVGLLEGPGPSTSPHDQEGQCLSVSLHPGAWTHIARLGGCPTWKLRRSDGRPLRLAAMLRIRGAALDGLLAAAQANALLRPTRLFRAWTYDDETDPENPWFYTTHTSRAEAEAEVDPDLETGPGGKPPVEEFPSWQATEKLACWWLNRPTTPTDAARLTGRAAQDAAIACLLAASGEFDGLWWAEKLDPLSLSAPRGALFPHLVESLLVEESHNPDEQDWG